VAERRPSPISRFLSGLRAVHEPGQQPDQELLGRFLAHADDQAFAQLVHRHGALVLSAARAVVGNAADAEDVFQATFLVLARRAASIRNQASLTSWLHGVARRLALKLRVSLSRRRGHEGRAALPPEARPMNDCTLQERDRLLHEELGRLPDKYRLPVLLCYWEGLTHEQAAGQVGWSRWTFKDRLERARALLRLRLERRGVTLSVAGLIALFAEVRAAAAVAAELAATAVKAALLIAAGQTGAGVASVAAVSLAQKGLFLMGWSKLQVAAAVVTAALTVVGGTLAYQGRGGSDQGTAPDFNRAAGPVGKELRAVKTEDLGKGPLGDRVKDGWRHVLIGKHETPVRGAVMSPRGDRLFTIGERGDALKVWNLKTLKLEHTFRLGMNATMGLALSPDGRSLLVSLFEEGKDVALVVIDAATLREIDRLPVKKDLPVLGLAFSPDGKRLATSTNAVTVWDWESRKPIAELQPSEITAGIRKVAFTPDGAHVLANCPSAANVEEGTVSVWNIEKKTEVASRDAGSQLLDCAAPSDQEIVLSTRKAVLVWRWQEDKVMAQIKTAKEALGGAGVADLFFGSLASAPGGKQLFVAVQQLQPAGNGKPKLVTQVRILDAATGDVVHRFEPSDAHFDCWGFGRAGQPFLCTQWNGSIWLLSPEAKAGK
jgi:RNA polymerase sigma factor (sigma-70 family)